MKSIVRELPNVDRTFPMFPSENRDMSESTWSLDETIDSVGSIGCDLINRIVAKMGELGWNEKDVFKIHMALEEAIMNSIKHGNADDPSKQVFVRILVEDNWFYADIADEGEGFNRDEVPDPTLEQNLLKETGRGVMLIEKFMSTVEYVGCGNRIKMAKKQSTEAED